MSTVTVNGQDFHVKEGTNYSVETVTNAAGRTVPAWIEGYGVIKPFAGAFETLPNPEEQAIPTVKFSKPGESKLVADLSTALKECGLKDGMTISLHHHLRNGCNVAPMIYTCLAESGCKDLEIAASSVHPVQAPTLIPLIENGQVVKIHTGLNGPTGKFVSEGNMKYPVVVRSHGSRVRAVVTGDIKIDIAVIAASAADLTGNANGLSGKNNCGPLAYAEIDSRYAKKVIVVTDTLVPYPCTPMAIKGTQVDHIVVLPEGEFIGNPKKISSTTTKLSRTEPGWTIAKMAADFMFESGYVKNGFSFQAGAGGASLGSVYFLGEIMRREGITASWANGGTTKYIVDMMKEGLVDKITTCQAFDIPAIESMITDMSRHVESSIDQYANPFNKHCVVHDLDVVVLGATEVDLDFNVNVNTHSDGYLLHNTGGHQDTAAGGKLAIIVAPVARGSNPIIIPRVTSITTPGECVDAIVTEVGIAINPKRTDLLEILKDSELPIYTMEELYEIGCKKAGRVPSAPSVKENIIGIIQWRDGTVIDVVYEVANPIPDGLKLKSDCIVKVEKIEGESEVEVLLYDNSPMVPVEEMRELALDMLKFYGLENVKISITDKVAEKWTIAARIEYALKNEFKVTGAYLLPLHPELENRQQRDKKAFRRSMLYVPGNNPYMMAKADCGADCVIYDMEDAVAPKDKPFARILARNALRAVPFGQTERQVRINQADFGLEDIRDIVKNAPVDLIFVPKVETAEELEAIEAVIDECNPDIRPYIVPLIESAIGVEYVFDIIKNNKENIVGLSMGLEDYTANIGAIRTKTDEESAWAQNRVNNAAAAFGLQSYDSVFSDFNDVEGLVKSVKRAKGLGFVGKRLIHPSQIKHTNKAFLPEAKELERAMAIVRAFNAANGGAVALGKKMIDLPVCERAQQVVRLAVKAGMIAENWE
ncbi:hypothetical protein PCE1_002754 [Barthelona sp. PCE]